MEPLQHRALCRQLFLVLRHVRVEAGVVGHGAVEQLLQSGRGGSMNEHSALDSQRDGDVQPPAAAQQEDAAVVHTYIHFKCCAVQLQELGLKLLRMQHDAGHLAILVAAGRNCAGSSSGEQQPPAGTRSILAL